MNTQKSQAYAHPNPAANKLGALLALGVGRLIRQSKEAGINVCDGFRGVPPTKPLFPERVAYTANYKLSEAEAQLYNDVTTYVKEEMNRADQLDGKRKGTVGFALTALQRRLASSPEAILQRCAN
jgi:hypothetical protein